jgi:hypothetical protein
MAIAGFSLCLCVLSGSLIVSQVSKFEITTTITSMFCVLTNLHLTTPTVEGFVEELSAKVH